MPRDEPPASKLRQRLDYWEADEQSWKQGIVHVDEQQLRLFTLQQLSAAVGSASARPERVHELRRATVVLCGHEASWFSIVCAEGRRLYLKTVRRPPWPSTTWLSSLWRRRRW